MKITFDVELVTKNDKWSANIEAVDRDSETTIKSKIDNNNSIGDCLIRVNTEVKIIMKRYVEIYAIKG